MKIIVAVDRNWGIGKDNELLFSLKQDMSYFRQKTLGTVVVMGRRTFESLPGRKPLKDRTNIIVSGGSVALSTDAENVLHVKNLHELFEKIKDETREVYVIGGASLYRTMLPYCTEALVTKVDAEVSADAFFENLDAIDDWQCEYESEEIEDNDHNIRFTTYKNVNVRKFGGE